MKRPRPLRSSGAIAVALVFGAVAWTQGVADAYPTRTGRDSVATPNTAGRKYVNGLVSDANRKTNGQAEKYAEPASPAAEYAKSQAVLDQVLLPNEVLKKSTVKGGFRVCDTKNNCITYTALRTQKGKLVTFDVNDKPLDQRLRTLTQAATDGPLTFMGRWAYRSGGGNLFAIVDVRNDGDRALLPTSYDSVWIDPSGRQQVNRLAGIAEAAPEVNGHAVGTMVLAFDDPEGQMVGRLILNAYDNNPPPGEPQAHYQAELPIG